MKQYIVTLITLGCAAFSFQPTQAMAWKQFATKIVKDAPTEYIPGLATGAFLAHLVTSKPRPSGSPVGNPAGELIQAGEAALKIVGFGILAAGYYGLVLAKKRPANKTLTDARLGKNIFASIAGFMIARPLIQYMTGQPITFKQY